MGDLILEGVLREAEVGYVYADITDVANQTVLRHNCDPVAAHLLGRATTAGVLCSRVLGEHERLNLRWHYTGVLRTLIVDVGYDGTVRSLVSPAQLGGELENKTQLYGEEGDVNVIRLRHSRVMNSGNTQSVFMDEVDDLAFYYCSSEQVEISMLVMIGFSPDPERPVDLCHGLMLQALPACDLMQFQTIRERLDGRLFRDHMATHAEREDTLPNLLQAILPEHIKGLEFTVHQGPRPIFSCTCSNEKMQGVVQMITGDDRREILEANEPLKVRCEFCNEQYVIGMEACRSAWGM